MEAPSYEYDKQIDGVYLSLNEGKVKQTINENSTEEDSKLLKLFNDFKCWILSGKRKEIFEEEELNRI